MLIIIICVITYLFLMMIAWAFIRGAAILNMRIDDMESSKDIYDKLES